MLVHGDNLIQKENHKEKYTDSESKRFLIEIRTEYQKWKDENEMLKGPFSELNDSDVNLIYKE